MRGLLTRAGGVLVVALASMPLLGLVGGAGAATPLQINGSGSSWAANAINLWVRDVYNSGVEVSFTPDGDSQGRQDFANNLSDFSVTADGFQGFDSTTGVSDTSNGRPYAYLPVAAGGTSFPYQIKFDGTQVENLRLSGETLAKIFTNQITNWDDPEITKDNNGIALPSIPIVPVVQSEGSGATQQLTDYFATEYPSIWDSFAGQSGPTEYFPRQGDQIAQNGSTGAMNYIASSAANGSIGYVEYSYPLNVGYPVAKVLNSGGYYTLPTQYNVAIALEQAQINMDPSSPNYLLQTLTNVYTDPDPRTYPLSSYVYMIEPTGGPGSTTNDPSESSGKRQSIADFEYYSICQGQSQIGGVGYSPLPVNLVEAAFSQIQKLQQADPTVDLSNLNILTCNEPTFVPGQPNTNYLTTIAPQPPSCDQQGAGPCAAGVTPNGIGPSPTVSGTYPGTHAVGSGSTASGSSATAAGTGASETSGASAAGATSATEAAAAAARAAAASAERPPLDSVLLPGRGLASEGWIVAAVSAVLFAAFAVPILIGYRRSRRRREVSP
ncbi:MAG: substrate-binding domain-containing protein [Acidimicrobiales bacterium]